MIVKKVITKNDITDNKRTYLKSFNVSNKKNMTICEKNFRIEYGNNELKEHKKTKS